MTGSRYLSPKSLAEFLDVSVSTIWRMVEAGKLPRPNYLTPALPRFDLVTVEAKISGERRRLVTDAKDIDDMIARIQPGNGRQRRKINGRSAA